MTTENTNPREERGKEIAQKQDVTRINDDYYTVKSQTTSNKYDVVKSGDARNFALASKKVFYTNTTPRTVHISHIHLKGDRNNNRMERLNNEIRDREKVMRSLKKQDTPIVEGYRIYHNYFRPHMALDGKTPAETSGIKIEGDNKWITVIQNASRM